MHINRNAQLRFAIAGSLVAGFLTIGGCKAKDAQPVDGAAAATSTSASSTPSASSSAQVDADASALAAYPLTTDRIAKVTQVMQTVRSMEKADPALAAQWNADTPGDNAKTVDEAVDRINKAPRAAEIFRSAGISAHDFVYTSFALMYASMAYELKKAGRPMPPGTFGTRINPANIDFVAAHQAEIKALNAASAETDSTDS